MAINKVEFGGRTLIDLTDTTATADKILTGYGAYGKDGVWVDGTAIESSPDGAVYQDSEGYVVLDDGPGTHVEIESLNVTENGTYTAPTGCAYSPVSVDVEPNLQSKSATPTETAQTITADSGYDGLSQVNVGAISSTYVGSGISRKTSSDLTVSGATVTAPSGYYPFNASKSVASATQATPTMAFASATGLVTATATQTSGYVSAGTKSSTYQLPVKAAATYTPTETTQTIGSYQWLTGTQTIAAISSTYVGTGVTQRSAADMTASGSYVTAPAGYYSEAFSRAVSAGSGILTAGGGRLSTSLTINSSTGLITKTSSSATFTVEMQSGTFVSGYFSSYTDVKAAAVTFTTLSSTIQLPTLAATTYTPTEAAQTIASYQWLTGVQTIAAISSTYVGTGVTQRSAVDMTVNGSYVTAPAGYYSQAFSKAVNIGSADIEDITVGRAATLTFSSSTGYIYASYSTRDTVSVPAYLFSPGYFSSNTDILTGGVTHYGSASLTLPTLAATTYTPTTTAQTIPSYRWLTGAQTIAGDTNLVSGNIRSGVSIFGVVGTVSDENDLPTVYRTWDDSIGEDGGYVYSCNYTYSQVLSMLTDLNGDPLAGEFHDITNSDTSSTVRIAGGTWIIDYNKNDPVFYAYPYDLAKFRYCSDSSFEEMPIFQIKNVTPSMYARYVFAEYPYDYLSQVTVAGDNNLISSNIRFGVSIFGVQGTLSADRSFENNIVQRKYISSYVNNDISMIGSYAFAFQNIAYMECLSVKSIYSYAFQYAGYSTFSNGMNFPSCSFLGTGVFYGARMGKVSFPNCKVIGESCFYSCASLTEVSFPNCTTISQSAFYSASRLISANFPHVTSIEQYAFYGCFKLTSISFPECTRIGNCAFQECGSLENVYLPILNNSVYTSCTYLFAKCSNLSSINLPAMTTIGQNMFYSCTKLENVSIPLCKSIFDSAFYNCTGLSSISFSLCTSIYSGAFLSCTNLIDVNLPVLTTIQWSVFENCTALESINLPSVQRLMTDTFFNCTNLKNVSLPVCSIFGYRAFGGCSSLAFNNIYAPNVTLIGGSAFTNCIGFSEVFYSNITFEGSCAFAGCQNLTSVTFINCPGIWTYTFVSCYNLLSLYLLGSSVTALSNRSAFNSTPIYNYTTSTGGVYGSIYVPASLYDSYRTATNWTTFSSRFVSLTDAEIAALNT